MSLRRNSMNAEVKFKEKYQKKKLLKETLHIFIKPQGKIHLLINTIIMMQTCEVMNKFMPHPHKKTFYYPS